MAAALVIACGNQDRGDDAAGPLVAASLQAEAGVGRVLRVVTHRGDALGLIELWAGQDHVILVDALSAPLAPGTVARFDASAGPLEVELGVTSTHGLGASGAIEMARALGRLPGRLEVYAIAGSAFGIGEPPGPAVSAAARRVAEELIGRFRDAP